jgi:hypothetical protein
MATAGDVINSALRSIGQLAEGETPSAETSSDCLSLLNEMLDSWSNERLMAPYLQEESFTLTGNDGSYTIGTSQDFNTTRPIKVDDASYTVLNGISYPLRGINKAEYDSIQVKDTAASFPSVFYYEASYPNAVIKFYPIPNSAITFKMVSWKQQTQMAGLATAFSVQPGEIRAIRANLAIEIASQFGVEAPASVVRTAIQSKRNLKRVNGPNDVLSMPTAILRRLGQGNIYGDIT